VSICIKHTFANMMKPMKKSAETLRRDVLFIEVLQFAERLGAETAPHNPMQRESRRLVQAWFDSDKNVGRLFEAHPLLAQEGRTFRADVVATRTGRAKLAYSSDPLLANPTDPQRIAVEDFFNFLLNPSNETLRGPCAYCGKYFANRTNRKKLVYCSETCGRRFTSRFANAKQREEQHNENLRAAKRSIARWSKTKTKEAWKEWVFRETRISKNWLTRAAKNEKFVVPVKWPRAKS
jgi:hypothetical protein